MSTLKIAVFEKDQVDSTSAEASQLLASGEASIPFVVTASEQLSGKGRMGKAWESPIGNLYVTFALPVLLAKDEPATLLPLKVATLVSWWLAVQHNLRITIKWPNDLMFAGRKMGGILCETTVDKDGACKYVLAGIGLNVNVVPNVLDGYRPTSYQEVMGHTVEISALRESLIRFFAQHWNGVRVNDSLEDFKHFGIESGQVWLRNGSLAEAYVSNPLESGGGLTLRSLKDASVETLHNATDQFHWLYSGSGEDKMPLVVADIGNTSIKLAYYENIEHSSPNSFKSTTAKVDIEDWCVEVRERLSELGVAKGAKWPIHYISTNEENVELFKSAAEASFHCLHIPHRPVRYEGQYNVSLMGQDRLAAIEGALAKGIERPMIVASVGSALTVDFLTAEGVHLGGWIGPGQQMQLDVMGEAADALPHLAAGSIDALPGNLLYGLKTSHAMCLGVREGIIGSLARARTVMAKQLGIKGGNVDITATGGSAGLFADALQPYAYEPHLVVEGLRNMVRGGSHKTP